VHVARVVAISQAVTQEVGVAAVGIVTRKESKSAPASNERLLEGEPERA